MRPIHVHLLSASAVAALSAAVFAAPVRDIRPSGGLIKLGPPTTGPIVDPLASNGQWFVDFNGVQSFRPYEFYDNIPMDGGGFAGSNAIRGTFLPVFSGTSLIGFNVAASITNDMPGLPPQGGGPGRNSHLEEHFGPNFQAQTMFDVKLTAEFALAQGVLPPGGFTPPYFPPTGTPIIANNPDQLGWYCYTPGNAALPPGDYLVPTYDFGTIAPGQTVNQTLSFSFQTPIPQINPDGTPNQEYIYYTGLQQHDVFMNRSHDLKIGDWLDVISDDDGSLYPFTGAKRSGNVSVFFVPEPSVMTIVVAGGLLALRRRRTSAIT